MTVRAFVLFILALGLISIAQAQVSIGPQTGNGSSCSGDINTGCSQVVNLSNVTNASLANSGLANDSITLGGQAILLGASVSTLSGNLTFSGTDNFTGTFEFGGNAITFPGSAATLTYRSGSFTNGDCMQASGTAGAIADSGAACGGQWTAGAVATLGANLAIASTTINTTYPVETAQTSGFSFAATDMGKTIPVNIGGGGTITVPATGFGSTIFGAGQVACVQNIGATADTITNSSGATMYPTIATLDVGSTLCFQGDGTNFYAQLNANSNLPAAIVATTQSQNDNSTKVATTAYVDRATNFATGSSTGNTLTGPREYFVCTAACTVTPPVPVAGYEFCVMNDDNVTGVITLGALGSSARYENTARTAYGTAGTGTFASGGAAADKVCIVGRDSTHYITTSFNGTWTAS